MNKKREITVEQVQELLDMLTGRELPDGITLANQPHLSNESAFSVIWFLQERLRVLPDHFEQCQVCGEIFDDQCEGYTIGDCDYDDQWYRIMGITPEDVEENAGTQFCSEGCEVVFWRDYRAIAKSEVSQ